MYLVKIYDGPNDTTGIVIHSPYVGRPKISTGIVTLKITGIDEFSFTFNNTNPGYRKIKPFTTLIKVIDIKRKKIIFDGRILKPKYSMSSGGMFTDSYICESKLAYLHDSSQRWAEVRQINVRDFFVKLIERHNQTVEPHKRFIVGNVTVVSGTIEGNLWRFIGYGKTYEEIKEDLIEPLGGYLRLREEPDGTYIDYLAEVGEVKQRPRISIRRNLKSISREIDSMGVITRLVPLGTRLEDDEADVSAISSPRLTISQVNNGIDYLDDLELQKHLGIIEREVTWDDITLPINLLSRGREFLETQAAALETLVVNAVDLSLIGLEIDSFYVGDKYYIDNPFVISDLPWQIIQKKIDIKNPQESSLTFGDKQKTLTQFQANFNKSQRNVVELQNTVNSQGRRISNVAKNVTVAQQEASDANQLADKINKDLINHVADETTHISTDERSKWNDKVSQRELQSAINEIGAQLVPPYWRPHLEQKINQVRNLQDINSMNRTSFAFVTDIHVPRNAGNSGVLMREVIDKGRIDILVNGGDISLNPTLNLNREAIFQQFDTMFDWYDKTKDKMMITRSNHDINNYGTGSVESSWLTNQHKFSRLHRHLTDNEKIVWGPDNTYFYRDDSFNRVRYIALNDMDAPFLWEGHSLMGAPGTTRYGFRQAQLDWFGNVALRVPGNDWSVVVLSHMPPRHQGVIGHEGYPEFWLINGTEALDILWAFRNGVQRNVPLSGTNGNIASMPEYQGQVNVDFRGAGGDVIAWISGHTHHDNIVNYYGIPIVTTVNDCLDVYSTAPNKIKGTATEQAFDIFTMDLERKSVNVTRIGAGSDRSFIYGDTFGNLGVPVNLAWSRQLTDGEFRVPVATRLPLKPNTTYTLWINTLSARWFGVFYSAIGPQNPMFDDPFETDWINPGISMITFTTQNINAQQLAQNTRFMAPELGEMGFGVLFLRAAAADVNAEIMVLEGDWTEQNLTQFIPPRLPR